MAPNLFVCLRIAFCPRYWFHRGDRVNGSIAKTEHWDSPVPGVYRYIPGRGWYLISRDGQEDGEKLPMPLVYCRIVHRYLLEDEMEDRCSWHCIQEHDDGTPVKRRFFLLDDGYTWVAGWDDQERFIPGPYQKWRFDPGSNSMYKVGTPPPSANVSRRSSVVLSKWD